MSIHTHVSINGILIRFITFIPFFFLIMFIVGRTRNDKACTLYMLTNSWARWEHTLRLCKFYVDRYRCSTCVCMIFELYTQTHTWKNTPRTQNGFLNQTAATTVECVMWVIFVLRDVMWCGQRARQPDHYGKCMEFVNRVNEFVHVHWSCVDVKKSRWCDGHHLQWTITIVQSRIVVMYWIFCSSPKYYLILATFLFCNYCALWSFTTTSNSVLSEQWKCFTSKNNFNKCMNDDDNNNERHSRLKWNFWTGFLQTITFGFY